MPPFGKKGKAAGPTQDEMRERRLDAVKKLAERFTYDMGLLIAGHTVNFEEYLASSVATRLRAGVEPFLASGDAMRPNFGEYGELRVEGDLLSNEDPIHAYIEFDDQSVRVTSAGDLIPGPKRRMIITLRIAPGATSIEDATLRPVDS